MKNKPIRNVHVSTFRTSWMGQITTLWPSMSIWSFALCPRCPPRLSLLCPCVSPPPDMVVALETSSCDSSLVGGSSLGSMLVQHTNLRYPVWAYVSIRQHTSTCDSIRQHATTYVSIHHHTPANTSIRQHTSAYVSIRQHTSSHVSIRQHTSYLRNTPTHDVLFVWSSTEA
jgi:hypothetical protein